MTTAMITTTAMTTITTAMTTTTTPMTTVTTAMTTTTTAMTTITTAMKTITTAVITNTKWRQQMSDTRMGENRTDEKMEQALATGVFKTTSWKRIESWAQGKEKERGRGAQDSQHKIRLDFEKRRQPSRPKLTQPLLSYHLTITLIY
ncbi:hypothetical protein LOAG_14091 [Loa loa]|uniref:Uncharacterized protein n=1 Tax=Loa loa TaxID=7209 RepID=A0A1S0TIF5_LOALO|nr:hypothetical protein LOAG_14091 [Loa loa]EFO14428.1 hypothetical protein LOAG_14091 [Loa loa]